MATVNLPDVPGHIDITYLTGQGRASTDFYAILRRQYLRDESNNQVNRDGSTAITLKLTGFQSEKVYINVPMDSQHPSGWSFDKFYLDPSEFLDGTTSITPTNTSFVSLPAVYSARIRTLPGRDTSVPVFLDESMFMYDSTAGTLTFDDAQFRTNNLLPTEDPTTNGLITGFLSDYVRFDLSGLDAADRPTLVVNGEAADAVYFSGDAYAVSNTVGTERRWENLTVDPTTPIDGWFTPASTVDGRAFPGTFSNVGLDPTDLDRVRTITALQGIFRESDAVLNLPSTPAFQIIAFPNSNERYDANYPGDMVAFTYTWQLGTDNKMHAKMKNFYYGFYNYTAKTFKLYPIKNIVTADVDGEITGTISNTMGKSGATTFEPAIRTGTYTFDAAQTLPTGFLNTGTFVVFRR